MRTRFIKLGGGKLREGATNRPTLIGQAPVERADPDLPFFQGIFEAHYPRLLEARSSFGEAGVLVAAAHDALGELEVIGVPVHADRPSTAIVGRHGEADLYLERDPALSLRHLAVLVSPRTGTDPIRVRLVDLRTPLGFQDERGRRLDGVHVDGPFFARVGTYTLMLLPTDPTVPWPRVPREAWQALPARTFEGTDRGVRHLGPEPGTDGPDGPRTDGRSALFTYVTSTGGPARARLESLVDGERPWGRLVLSTARGSDTLVVGTKAARRGVLLGSYDRCDSDYLVSLDDDYLSRVHLLVISDGDRLYAIDTSSTNGTSVDGQRVRCADLTPGGSVLLAGSVSLRWHPA